MYPGRLLARQREDTHKMLSVVPGTEQALRHSSYVIINPIDTEIGFLPKIERRGMILDWGWRWLVLRFLSCSPAGNGATAEHSWGRPPSLLSSEEPSPQQPHQLRPGAPVPSRVTASPQQPVRMAKADLDDGTGTALAEELLRDPRLHRNHIRKEREERGQSANKHRAMPPSADPKTPRGTSGRARTWPSRGSEPVFPEHQLCARHHKGLFTCLTLFKSSLIITTPPQKNP